jgi:dCMP deaminase
MKKKGAEKSCRTHRRASWDEYFMDLAELVSTRATCDRKHVGAIIVKDKRVLASGYNGSIPGLPHCDDIGHDLENDHCVATVHAEQNAIVSAARFGISIDGSTMYCNTFPCWNCFKLIVSSGIVEVIFKNPYGIEKNQRVLDAYANLHYFKFRQVKE